MRREWSYRVEDLRAGRNDLPRCPGVYVFRDDAGSALYVGKSRNLRSRVRSYFRPGARHERKSRTLQQLAVRVDLELTGSDFAALLREVDLVQELAPSLNRRLRHPERYAWIALDTRDPFPRLDVTTEPWPGGRFLGPFANVRRVRAALEVLTDTFHLRTCDGRLDPQPEAPGCWRLQVRTCSAPCRGVVSPGEYGRQLLPALLAASGRSARVRETWERERDRHAAAERFESAARLQRQIAALDRVRRNLFITERVWHDGFVVQPDFSPGQVRLWRISSGTPQAPLIGTPQEVRAALPSLRATYGEADRTRPRLIAQRDLDRRWIVHRWLRSPEGQPWSVLAPPGQHDIDLAPRLHDLLESAAACLFPTPRDPGPEEAARPALTASFRLA